LSLGDVGENLGGWGRAKGVTSNDADEVSHRKVFERKAKVKKKGGDTERVQQKKAGYGE